MNYFVNLASSFLLLWTCLCLCTPIVAYPRPMTEFVDAIVVTSHYVGEELVFYARVPTWV